MLSLLLLVQAERPPAAQPRTEAALYDWYRCMFDSVRSGADETGAADALTDTAFAACTAKEQNLRAAVKAEGGAITPQDAQRKVASYRVSARPIVQAFVLDVRRIRSRTARERY